MRPAMWVSVAVAVVAAAAAPGVDAGARAQTVKGAGAMQVVEAWARETPPRAGTGGAFITVRNLGSAADRLIAASTPAAARVEVHEMRMDGPVMRMRPLPDGLPIPARSQVRLRPGGWHLMLIGLRAPLRRGSTVPLRLWFARAGTVDTVVRVTAISATSSRQGGR